MLKTFGSSEVPDYAILSHRWGEEEVTFKDMIGCPISDLNSPARRLTGFSKIEGSCKLAIRDGYEWIWIDTCCIDKDSSTDVDKAINSMWNYYTKSNVCYVYMSDVPNYEAGRGVTFQKSKWFTRGWTLQELVAPVFLEFYAANWSLLGTKLERSAEIANITTIDIDLLAQINTINDYTTAELFSWAAHRQVSQEEDEAYSLLGLFQINMPMIYGEGRTRAFMRLQEAIYLATCDDSIFLFSHSPYALDHQPLLADCSARFCQREPCELCQHQVRATQLFPADISYDVVFPSSFWPLQPHEQLITTVTPFRNEVSVSLSILEYAQVSSRLVFFDEKSKNEISHVAVLNHSREGWIHGAFCLLLFRPSNSDALSFYRNSSLPAFLPNVKEFTSYIPKTKILISGPDPQPKIEIIHTIFSVSGALCHDPNWDSKNIDTFIVRRPFQQRDIISTYAEFEVQTTNQKSNIEAEVSCQLIARHGLDEYPEILVRLERIIGIWIWSIKEILETKSQSHKRQKKKHVLFSSKAPSDSCTISLHNGKKLYVRLRRLAATNKPGGTGFIRQERYQIVLSPVEDGRSAAQEPIDVDMI